MGGPYWPDARATGYSDRMATKDATRGEIKAGEVVKLTRPVDAAEAAARYDVVELRGDRVLIRLRCNLPIPPMEAVAKTEVAPAGA